jgi:hypothetical protein
LAAALEDAAVLLAARDRMDDAVAAGREALRLFGSMAAGWDVDRARRRMAARGISAHELLVPAGPRRQWS